jgi:hypothetical protein
MMAGAFTARSPDSTGEEPLPHTTAVRRAAVYPPAARVEPLEPRALLSGSIAGLVYDDLNADGERQPDDPPLAGQMVSLSILNGEVFPAATTVTGAGGRYRFDGLEARAYIVRWQSDGSRFLTAPSWTEQYTVDLPQDVNATGLDFGTARFATLSGSVFDDADRDGVRDPGETGAAGQVVYIDYDEDGVRSPGQPFVTTDANGDYRFATITPGFYRVRLEPAPGWRRSPGSVDYHDTPVRSGDAAIAPFFAVSREPSLGGLTLINAATDRPIRPLRHGDTIDLAEVGQRLNVRADPADGLPAGEVRSVRFNFDGDADYRIENGAPYALAGDTGGDFHSWRPTLGTHALVVTPYAGPNATGERGLPYLMTFNVVDGTRDGRLTLRVDAGGRGYTTAAGDPFGPDSGFHGGVARRDTFAVSGTDDDALYASRRAGPRMLFSKPVASGLYTLKLHFAEPTFTEAGRRLFDVVAEGRRLLDDYDVFADAGTRTAVVKQFPVRVADGRLEVSFVASHDAAVVSAIELVPRPRGPARPGPVLVDAGAVGGATDSLARVFEPDNGFTGGTTSTALFDVDGDNQTTSGEDALFSSCRSGPRFTFSRPVADGNYAIFLGLIEPDAAATSGSRRFDVFAEGRRAVQGIDVAKQAGGARVPAAVQFDVRVADGSLELSFVGLRGDAIVSSLVVLPTDVPDAAKPYTWDAAPEARRDFRSASNLRMIGIATTMYMNEHRGRTPPDLATVAPYVEDVRPFADPRAGTDLPRGELSDVEEAAWAAAHDDYVYVGAGLRVVDLDSRRVLAYENSRRVPGNLLVLFGDGHVGWVERNDLARRVGFDPAPPADPPVFPDPTTPPWRPDPNVLESGDNLRTLMAALRMHANERRGRLPNDFGRLYETQDLPLSAFVNPRGDGEAPAGLTREQAIAWAAASTDYLYLGAGGNYTWPLDVAIVAENPAEMEGGINFVFPDGRAEFREMRWAIDTIRRALAGRR